ncbi:AtzG-like protein [Acidihalobacter ferrooxydans]|uniref:DUF4089 domain-containing protein n=1 Tax=Acidihalobacter ferrooxydans TaxID=1765967 RepID=A0A1P8UHF2_9GAMM|nr:AtzG-like protein [Acidihalobacter ferrooxydans]APZ43273.1 hypothetical protein BW247_09345 [Acidihalobacter ferrooxydans]
MTPEELDAYIDLTAAQQKLTIEPAWRESVVTFYQLAARMAEVLEGHPLPPEEEPAPVFTA